MTDTFFFKIIELAVSLAISADIMALGIGTAVRTYRGIVNKK